MPDQKLSELTNTLVAFPADPANLMVYVVDLTEPLEDNRSKKATLTLIDTRYQPLDADLTTIASLAKADGNFIVADGAAWTVKSGATARASLGLGTLAVINSPLPIINGGSGQATQQAAIDALTNVAAATNEHVLTKDTVTGNAIFKAGAAALPVVDETAIVYETGVPANTLTFNVTPYTAPRVVTWPDAALTVAGLEVANVFTAVQKINVNSALALLVEQDGVKDNVFIVNTTAGLIGVNTVPDANRTFHIFSQGAAANSSAVYVDFRATGNFARLHGMRFVLYLAGANSQTSSDNFPIAVDGVVSNLVNGATINLVSSFNAHLALGNNYTTTIKKWRGYSVAIDTPHASPTIEETYGLYIPNLTLGTLANYAIYTNAGLNQFGDQVAIVGSADRDQLSVTGFTTQTNSPAVITGNTATTNAVLNSLRLVQNTTGTGAAGLGVALQFQIESSTTAAQEAARLAALWQTATHASRVADLVAYASYSGGESEIWRGRAGAAPLFGVLGATPVVRQTHIGDPAGGGTVDAEARTAINSILNVLEAFGFVATS